MGRLPDFVIIGAMKCATSTLHEQLDAQPGIFMSSPKEPNFFSDEDRWRRGKDWYTSLFRGARGSDLCGESSTHYTKLPRHPRTLERLAPMLPEAKFVYVMRQPIERLVSHYIHDWTERVISEPIDEAIDAHPDLVAFGQYAMQLEPWLEQVGPQRILPVFFERLRDSPQSELERICQFVGYEASPKWRADADERNTSAKRMRISWLRDALVHAPVLSTIRRRLVPRGVRDRIKSWWMMSDRPELSASSQQRLQEAFDPDLARLGRWLGLDLSCDTFAQTARATAPRWALDAVQT